ncbi:MAG: hypothetical protein MJE66_10740 [Proteobacteria bacterium]|nr:hypothetical protein [Pseudomonadota bacterium]
MHAVTDGKAAAASGVPHAEALVAFAEAALGRDAVALEQARSRVAAELGVEALVDAAAVVANFQRMVRIADSTGIPLDAPLEMLSQDVREELDLGRFAAAANTPEPSGWRRLAGPVLRRLFRTVFRGVAWIRSRSKRPDRGATEDSC